MGMTLGSTSEVSSPSFPSLPKARPGFVLPGMSRSPLTQLRWCLQESGSRKMLCSGNPSGGSKIKCFNYGAPQILILPGASSDAPFKAQLGLICLTNHGLHYPKCRLNFPLKGPQMHRTKDEARSQCIISAEKGETSLVVWVLILQTN